MNSFCGLWAVGLVPSRSVPGRQASRAGHSVPECEVPLKEVAVVWSWAWLVCMSKVCGQVLPGLHVEGVRAGASRISLTWEGSPASAAGPQVPEHHRKQEDAVLRCCFRPSAVLYVIPPLVEKWGSLDRV